MEAFSSVGAIAAGNTSAAISGVERSLAASIPLALGFLGQLLHLGNIGGRVKGIIGKLRGKLERVQEKVMKRVAALIDKVLGKVKTGASNTVANAKKFISGIFGKKSFTGGKEAHSVWVETKNNRSTMMIASTPMEATQQVLGFARTAKKKLGVDPEGIYSKFIQPQLSYALSGIKTKKQKLAATVSKLPVGKRAAKMEMSSKASNITARVAELTKNLLDEIAKHTGNSQTMPLTALTFPAASQSGTKYDQQELKLQLAEQENSLRRMSVAKWLRRYPLHAGANQADKDRVKTLDSTARVNARKQYESDMIEDLTKGLERQYIAEGMQKNSATARKARSEAMIRVEAFMKTQAALHMPDKIAGGHYLVDINGVGDRDVNSFIGSQWKSGNKIGLIKTNCELVPLADRATTYLNVRLGVV